MTYRPLPSCLTIKESDIDGLGLFAKEDIEEGVDLGVSHISHSEFEDGYIRTPLGGFVNHSETPNCKFIPDVVGNIVRLFTTDNVTDGTELVTKYWLYNIGENK